MHNIYNHNEIGNRLPEPPRSTHIQPDGNTRDPENYFNALESEFWLNLGADPDAVNAAIQKAAVKWACISSKSHRDEKNALVYTLTAYDMKAEVKPIYERVSGSNPPTREGEVINKFSKKSRSRLLDKFRRMRKDGLTLPYFVTLTYRDNFKDCKKAKKHLDAFLKRWRRECEGSGEFRYAWKMEFQTENYIETGRCAIHFHLAIWLPEPVISRWTVKSKYPNERLKPLRQLIGCQWAEITREVDGTPNVPFTKIKFYRKKNGKYSVYNIGSGTYTLPDVWHERYGTNVREVDNLRQAAGYMAAYLGETIPDSIINEYDETGRFWGFSQNFDFSALHCYAADVYQLEQINEVANRLNEKFWQQYKQYQLENAARVKKQFADKPKIRDIKLEIIAKKSEAQARRYEINKHKIKRGYSVSFQLLAEDSNDIFLDILETPIKTTDYFEMRREILEYPMNN